jgi:hypothetical protein
METGKRFYLSIYLSVCLSVCPPTHPTTYLPTYLPTAAYHPRRPWPLFQFLNPQTVGLLGLLISTSQGRYLHTEQLTDLLTYLLTYLWS